MLNLDDLGWDAAFADAFAPHLAAGLVAGRVAIEDKHAYRVVTTAGELAAKVTGRLLHHTRTHTALPKVGDWVALAPEAGTERATIHRVLPRRTAITRQAAGTARSEQVLAANVDTAFLVQALDISFNLRRLERFLVMVREGGVQPVVVLNKADLCEAVARREAEARALAGPAPVVVTSAQSRRGVSPLKEFLHPARTVVFIGASGVGKSSLINQLYGEEIQATIEVREHDAKGRHTTAWRELIMLPGGALVIDTPGMREFHMWLAGEGLEEAFPEITELAAGCHFRDCTHASEKGCAVLAAVAAGQLGRDRHASFQKLRLELDYLAEERLRHTYLTRKRNAAARRNARHLAG
jgi:ribosome biogenesis GTPase